MIFTTNRILRAEVDRLRKALREEFVAAAKSVNEALEKARALDEELNGRPSKMRSYGYYTKAEPGVRQLLQQAEQRAVELKAHNLELWNKLDRVQRHNAALRDALTALGGAVIELQDHVEVRA